MVMGMREKLIEVLCNVPGYLIGADGLADHLIANGVTVQEWIPVKDRLPEDSVAVNLHTRSGVVGTGFYDKQTKSWVQCYSGGSLVVDVTHWMPMPEPPKEE